MKNIIIYFFILTYSINPIFGQERVNKVLPKLSAPISSLNQAKGYYYNTDGQWIEHDKNIANYDDFKKLEFRNLSYEGREVLVLLKYVDTGYFEYPSISKGWIPYTTITFYFIDKENYKEELDKCSTSCLMKFNVLKKGDLVYNSTFVNDIQTRSNYFFNNLPDNLDADEVYARVAKEVKPIYNLYIQYKTYPSKNITRFFIYDEKCELKKCELGGFSGNRMNTYKVFDKLKTDDIYSLYYYETQSSLFKNFIDLKPRQPKNNKK